MSILKYLVARRVFLEEEQPEIERMAAAGLAAAGLVIMRREAILACHDAEAAVKAALGDPA